MSLWNRVRAVSTLAALTAPLSLALVACGGKLDAGAFQSCPSTENCTDTGPIGDDGGTPDTQPDTGIPDTIIYPDGPSGCGYGPCTPGYACTIDSCTQAVCLSDGSWAFNGDCIDAPPACPASQPYNGQPCYADGQSCSYPTSCGSAYATCYGGAWSVATPDCPPSCPSFEPPAGSGCSAGGAKCSWTSTCGGNDTGYCDPATGRWAIYAGPCPGGCPASEPPSGSACSGSASCSWPNSCGGADYGSCNGGRWIISGGSCPPPPLCPGSEPASGSYCSSPGLSCGWTNSCGGYDKGVCTSSGWSIGYGGCTSSCPAYEPPAGSFCPSPGSSCTWANACGGTDYGYCGASGAWQITGSTCPAPVCPSATPKVGSACYSGLSCTFGNGCGGLDYWYCSAGSWMTKGPSPCTPGCPSGKPSTGSACKPSPFGASCSYVTDASNQCTTSCFCSDVGSWACTPASCSGGAIPPGVDGGVPVYDAPFASDAGFGL